MKFSETFHKAIAAIIPDNEADFERVLDLPEPLRNGQHITVFDDAAHGIFVCYGRIIGSEWNCVVGDYSYEIQVCQSKEVIQAYGWHVTPAAPEAMRMGFFKLEGGFPELAGKA